MPNEISEQQEVNKQLLRVTNLIGQESSIIKNIPLIYIYNNGQVEKKVIIE